MTQPGDAMPRSRRVVMFAVVALVAAGCKLFKPVNPNAPKSKPDERPPAEAAPTPANRTPTVVSPAPASTPGPTKTVQPAPAQNTGLVARPIPNAGNVNDANIAAMVLALNNTDISYARLVPARGERADIREFARRMLTDHVSVNSLVTDLMNKLDVTPEENDASLDMRDESATNRDLMRELTGYAFDSTYIENEIKYHRKFLASIDNVMIPRARNRELQTLLRSVRPAVAAHLAHAEQVRVNVFTKK